MNDQQLYLAIGAPMLGVILSVGMNVALYVHLSSRMEARMASIETKLDLLTGKIMEIDTRLSVLEDRLPR
ncbi:MAG: hypothetical protein M3Y07_03765 [Acidobacteriota bacterium]|nr:hypothetical protein [Acidobacteriota bacterium]